MTLVARYGLGSPRDESSPPSPDNPLRNAFERWMSALERTETDRYEQLFEDAQRLVAGLRPDAQEAEALIASREDHPHIREAGLFLSACHAYSPDRCMAYRGSFDAKLTYVGFRLPRDAALVIGPGTRVSQAGYESEGALLNLGSVDQLGPSAKGLILNLGEAADMGYEAAGVLLNFGAVNTELGTRASGTTVNIGESHHLGHHSGGLIVNLGEHSSLGRGKGGRFLSPGKKSGKHSGQPLRAYLDGIAARFGPSMPLETQAEALLELQRADISYAIDEQLRAGGYRV